MRKALPLLQSKENCAFPGYGFGGSIAREIRGGEVYRILSRDRGTMARASSSITQLLHKLAASPTSEVSVIVIIRIYDFRLEVMTSQTERRNVAGFSTHFMDILAASRSFAVESIAESH